MGGLLGRVKEVERLDHIVTVMLKHELGFLLNKLKLHTGKHQKRKVQPRVIVAICEELQYFRRRGVDIEIMANHSSR